MSNQFFSDITSHLLPMEWQSELMESEACRNQLIRIPTGFGKTLGVLSAWLWHRAHRKDERWPRRLVWCLPMRVLVEQTESEVRLALSRAGLLWDGNSSHQGKVGVHVLMGGANVGEWHLYPEECAVLIGTQDMLLSRAMNRGYASPRARWPMEFGLLNHDALWVMDEVQLMDVGLATATQLQAFREEERGKGRRPCISWWMSATLQRNWLEKSPDTVDLAAALPQLSIRPEQRRGALWDDVQKPCCIEPITKEKELATRIAEEHLSSGRGDRGPTLVVVNRVERAVEIFELLRKDKSLKESDIRLVHSRFRPHERQQWREEFLNRAASAPGTDRIIVSTQVVEAGVDISAGVLFTDLAPWASLVQRFGRCARWGGEANVFVIDFSPKDDKAAAPYSKDEIDAAREALAQLDNVSPLRLEMFEERHPELLARLYPFEPKSLLLRHELDELFDTTPDLTGADIDISRFIRSGEERDLSVFWAAVPEKQMPDAKLRPSREELCAVPFLKARDWLCGKETSTAKAPRLKQGMSAWVWDWLDGAWRTAERRDLYPGQTVLVEKGCGGYDPEKGWAPESKAKFEIHPTTNIAPDEQADASQDDESLSAYPWKTIATHGRETGALARAIASALDAELSNLFDLAGRWHDAGKAFPAFQNSITGSERPGRHDLAKAPKGAWLTGRALYPMSERERRPGFRHELISTLALFSVLQRHQPDHSALLGPWRDLLQKMGANISASPQTERPATPLEQEVLALDAERFNLLAYLVCSHHGKLRVAWHAAPADQEARSHLPRLRGVQEGDAVPSVQLCDASGAPQALPGFTAGLGLAAAGLGTTFGAGWTERVLGLMRQHGPFALAWMEALLRAADQRASRDMKIADPLLEADNGEHGLEADNRELAQAAPRGAEAHPPEPDSPQGGPQHGLRGGAGGSADAGSRTQAPHHATRYLETTLGILSYAELAPHLSLRVQALEDEIVEGAFSNLSIDEALILDLHHRICGDLVPAFAGRWRRVNVRVSDHEAPSYPQVPLLMRDYCRDLHARITALDDIPDERLLELLAFAEGRLLWIHPFEDFNGRITRVLLAEILQRLGLPAIDPTPEPGEETQRYLQALRAADNANLQPLIEYWRTRFEKEGNA